MAYVNKEIVTVATWNLNGISTPHSFRKLRKAILYCRKHNISILCIQETHAKSNQHVSQRLNRIKSEKNRHSIYECYNNENRNKNGVCTIFIDNKTPKRKVDNVKMEGRDESGQWKVQDLVGANDDVCGRNIRVSFKFNN